MAETVLAYLAEAAFAAGMAETGAFLTMYSAEIIVAAQVAMTVGSMYNMRQQQRAAEAASKAQYNGSLKDRYVMVRSAIEPRQYVLGRQRVSGPIAFVASYGALKDRLTLVLPVAAHEIDGFESVYFNDRLCRIDGAGNVTGLYTRDTTAISFPTITTVLSEIPDPASLTAWADYGTTRVNCGIVTLADDGVTLTVNGGLSGQTGTLTVQYVAANSPMSAGSLASDSATLSVGGGSGSITLLHSPVSGSVKVTMGQNDLTPYMTISGSVVTISGAEVAEGGLASGVATVSYQWVTSPTRAKITFYTGAPGQAADATLTSLYPSVWTAAHKMSGMAYLILDAIYDPEAWPSGIPNISTVVRGAKLYDPRTSATAWSENPALMQRWAILHPQIGNRSASDINDASVIVAANVCDRATAYNVNGRVYNRKLYTAGTVIRSGTKCKDVLDSLAQAMAGRWSFVDGILRTQAGDYVTPLQTLDDTWLHRGGSIQISPKAPRESLVNSVTGTFADQEQDFKVLSYPRVSASAYITEDGRELPTDMVLNAVTFTGQAQQCAAVFLRDSRQAMRLTLTCNLRAYPVEWGDSLTVSLPRFGISGVYQVFSVSFTIDGGIQLGLKETSSTIYALGATFEAQDPAPNTTLKSPSIVPPGPVLTLASGTSALLMQQDGTILSRIRVSWTLPADAAITEAGGGTEISYSAPGMSDGDPWMSIMVPPGESTCYLSGVQDGGLYLIKARFFNDVSRGSWGLQNLCRVVGKTEPPPPVASLTLQEMPSLGRAFVWDYPAPPLDLQGFESRYSAYSSATPSPDWLSMTPLFEAPSNSRNYDATGKPPDGEWTFSIRAVDTTGNVSAPIYYRALLDQGGFGTPLITVKPETLLWPGAKTYCSLSGSTLVDAGMYTWATTPATWAAWSAWAASAGYIRYEHTSIDSGSIQTLRLRADSVCDGVAVVEYQRSDDGATWTTWAALPAASITTRYIKARWTVTGAAAVLYRATITLYT